MSRWGRFLNFLDRLLAKLTFDETFSQKKKVDRGEVRKEEFGEEVSVPLLTDQPVLTDRKPRADRSVKVQEEKVEEIRFRSSKTILDQERGWRRKSKSESKRQRKREERRRARHLSSRGYSQEEIQEVLLSEGFGRVSSRAISTSFEKEQDSSAAK